MYCFLWGMNWIYICYEEESRPPLWASGQSSWLQIQRSRRYQIFWEVVGLERGPLSLVSTTEELLGRKSSGSVLDSREYGCRDSLCWARGTFYPQKLALASTTSGCRSVGIFRSRTQATEFLSDWTVTGKACPCRESNTGHPDRSPSLHILNYTTRTIHGNYGENLKLPNLRPRSCGHANSSVWIITFLCT
jgi:hypothetical protein